MTNEVIPGDPEQMIGAIELPGMPEKDSSDIASVVRDALETTQKHLTKLRADRDAIEVLIKDLVEQEETLQQAVGVFDRRAKKLAKEYADGATE